MFTRFSTKIGELEISIESGKLAKQADGGSSHHEIRRYRMLVTACAANIRKKEDFFFPHGGYRENFYARGNSGGFQTARQATEREVLTCRMIDSSIRTAARRCQMKTDHGHGSSEDTEIDPSMLAVTAHRHCFIVPYPL